MKKYVKPGMSFLPTNTADVLTATDNLGSFTEWENLGK